MSVLSNNATPPTPAIAPGSDTIHPRAVAAAIGNGTWHWPGAGPSTTTADPRITRVLPAFSAPFFQAGLAGYSDAAMRIIARRHGCPLCVTEALLDRTLLAGGRGFDKADLGELHDNIPGGIEDQPLVAQIMGSDPREMAAAAVKLVEQRTRSDKQYRQLAYIDGSLPSTKPHDAIALDPAEGLGDTSCEDDSCEVDSCGEGTDSCDPPDAPPLELLESEVSTLAASALTPARAHHLSFAAIDVNLACPVKKIDRKARGGHWLTEPRGAIALLEAVRDAVPAHIPCTVKMRRSYDDTPEMVENFHTIFDAAYRVGYAWATVHARTVEQKYVGPSRWAFLKDLRARHPDKPILGSGDIWNAEDIFRMLAYTGVSAVSVARGCIGNPWIFRQAQDMMQGKPPSPPTIREQRDVLRSHFALSLAVTRRFRKGEDATSKMMRKFGIRFATYHPRAEEVRQRFIKVSSTQDWTRVLEEMYSD